jgi:hypothetical protein
VHKGNPNISLVSANQDKKFNGSSKKYVLLFLREKKIEYELIRVKVSPDGCTKDKKIS